MELTERINQLLEEKFATDDAFSDCFVVEIELKPSNKLYVFLDSDSGMTFEKCQKLSRYLEGFIDSGGWLGDKYVLEVSSPGISRPLKFQRQYIKNIGRKLEVVLSSDKTKVIGLLKEVTDGGIVLTNEVVEKEGKKKIKKQVETIVKFDNIEKAIVKIEF
jgi:ribosome maturation factor RimP